MEKYEALRSQQMVAVDLYHKERASALKEQELKFSIEELDQELQGAKN